MEGIPGAVGGSLRMNAGAMGVETFDQVVRVSMVDADGDITEKTPPELEVHYRDVPVAEKQLRARRLTFQGSSSRPEKIHGIARCYRPSKRKTSQPIAASAGCIFKNPVQGMLPPENLCRNLD